MTPAPSACTAVPHDRRRRRHRPRRRTGPATESKAGWEQSPWRLFIVVPFVALVAAIPVAWGWGLGWRDVAIAFVMYAISGHGVTVGFHRYFTHGSFKANRALRDRPGRRRLAGHRGPGRALGRRPPQAPRVQRPRGRPALALALRRVRAARCPRACARRTWAGCSTSSRPRSEYAPDLLARPATSSGSPGLSRCCVAVSLLFPALLGGLLSWSWQGAVTAFFWALPGAHRRCCTTSPGRSTRSATRSASGRSRAATGRQRVVAGPALDGRVVAQPAPRRPDLRAARRAARPDRLQRPGHLALREARLGDRRPLARPTGSPRSAPDRRAT